MLAETWDYQIHQALYSPAQFEVRDREKRPVKPQHILEFLGPRVHNVDSHYSTLSHLSQTPGGFCAWLSFSQCALRVTLSFCPSALCLSPDCLLWLVGLPQRAPPAGWRQFLMWRARKGWRAWVRSTEHGVLITQRRVHEGEASLHSSLFAGAVHSSIQANCPDYGK